MADKNICTVDTISSMSNNTNVLVDENGALRRLNLKAELDNYSSDVMHKSDVVDNLTSDSTNLPLSANQGKVLDEKKAEWDLSFQNRGGTSTISDLDIDTLRGNNYQGMYWIQKSVALGTQPGAKGAYYTLLVFGSLQIAVTYSGEQNLYIRKHINGAWGSWRRYYTESDIDTMVNPTGYIKPTTNSNYTYVAGGYAQIGKMIVINLRINAKASSFTITGVPKPVILTSNIVGANVVNLQGGTPLAGFVTANAEIVLEGLTSGKEYSINATYICE